MPFPLNMCSQVLDTPIDILHVDESVVVVNKPPSIPVHPIGRYRVSIHVTENA